MVSISGSIAGRKLDFDGLHARKVSTFCPQIVMGGKRQARKDSWERRLHHEHEVCP